VSAKSVAADKRLTVPVDFFGTRKLLGLVVLRA